MRHKACILIGVSLFMVSSMAWAWRIRYGDPGCRYPLHTANSPSASIPFYLSNSYIPEGLTVEEVEQAVIDSFAMWEAVACDDGTTTYPQFEYKGLTDQTDYKTEGDGVNLVVFFETWPPPGVDANPASTGSYFYKYWPDDGRITDFGIALNADMYNWSVANPPPSTETYDVQAVVGAMIGQCMGLERSLNTADALVTGYYTTGRVVRSLPEDDQQGFCWLYGGNTAPVDPLDAGDGGLPDVPWDYNWERGCPADTACGYNNETMMFTCSPVGWEAPPPAPKYDMSQPPDSNWYPDGLYFYDVSGGNTIDEEDSGDGDCSCAMEGTNASPWPSMLLMALLPAAMFLRRKGRKG